MSEEGALGSVKHAAETALELAELAPGDVKVKIVNDAPSALRAGTEGGGVFTSGTAHFGKNRGAAPS